MRFQPPPLAGWRQWARRARGYYDASSARYAATRIAAATAGAVYRVSGPVAAVDGAQQFRLGSQAYAGSTAGLSAGASVRLKLERAPDDRNRAELDGVVVRSPPQNAPASLCKPSP